jgi:hypothetical protein
MEFRQGKVGMRLYIKGQSHGYDLDGEYVIKEVDKSDHTFRVEQGFNSYWTVPEICVQFEERGDGWTTL